MLYRLCILALTICLGCGFVPPSAVIRVPPCAVLHAAAPQDTDISSDEDRLNRQFEDIAKTLRLSLLHNGFESKDAQYGVENIRASIPIDPSLGLELTEVASSTTKQGTGLVLVSHVCGNAAKHTSIQVGDSIVSVACDAANFRESVTGLDYDGTMDTVAAAKTHAQLMGEPAITLQLNRLVPRAKVQVIIENNQNTRHLSIEGLAGDNLRLLLVRKKVDINQGSTNCGGGGSCGTCMVGVLEGAESLDSLVPNGKEGQSNKSDESTTLSYRKACQTVIGANNQESTIRLRLP